MCFFIAYCFLLNGQTKALVGGTLINGFGGAPIHNSVIIVEGNKIVKVGHQGNTDIPKDAEVISTEGKSVMPGLWDMHVHLMINGHSDYSHWDTTYIDDLASIVMPSSALHGDGQKQSAL